MPFVSLLVPCWNEEKFIGQCLDSLIAQDYPKESLEILVIDGMSEDNTRNILQHYAEKYSFIKVLDNPKIVPPAAFNKGVANAKGDLIALISAHSIYPKDYISKCVKYIQRYDADNVGGILNIIPRCNSLIANAIADSVSHPFASGNSYVKVGTKKPRWADTAAFGCYKREVFEKIGSFNEELSGSSDLDFNKRLKQAGGKILVIPDIVIGYYADADLKTFLKHNFADGVWATYVLRFKSRGFSLRHIVPFIFLGSIVVAGCLAVKFPFFKWSLVGIVGTYTICSILISIHLALIKKKIYYLWIAPVVFAFRHIGYGVGSFLGLVMLFLPRKVWRGRRSMQD